MTDHPPVTDHLHVTLDAEPHLAGVARLATRRWLAALHWPESSTAELVFAIGEAVGNSIEHAYREPRPGRVIVDLAVESVIDGRVARAVVTDFGRWRRVQPRRDRGNGLALIRTVVRWLRIDSDDDGTRVAMRSAPVPYARPTT